MGIISKHNETKFKKKIKKTHTSLNKIYFW
jgi:hypothetical protein